jgi:hypothetical protein
VVEVVHLLGVVILLLVLRWVEDWQKHYPVEMDIGTIQIIVVTVLQVVTTILIAIINQMVGPYLVQVQVHYCLGADDDNN